MQFRAVIGEQVVTIELPEDLLRDSAEFHARLDRDMDRGWQMSREFVESPDRLQRCQIVADIEHRWSAVVGEKDFSQMCRTMQRLLDELDPKDSRG